VDGQKVPFFSPVIDNPPVEVTLAATGSPCDSPATHSSSESVSVSVRRAHYYMVIVSGAILECFDLWMKRSLIVEPLCL